MEDFTPTTEDVRLIWIISQTGCKARAEFDRWLNEVKAEVWEEGAYSGYDDALADRETMRNPYTTHY